MAVTSRLRRSVLPLALLGVAAGACRAGKPKAPTAGPEPGAELIQSYVGENRILAHRGDDRAVAVRKGEALAGECDAAVVVRSASLDKGAARFSLEILGKPNAGREPKCRPMPSGIGLTVSGFAAGDDAEQMKASIDALLPTPEAYLKAKGVAFDRPPGPDEKEMASQAADASGEERSLARKVTAWPKKLLSVDPWYHDPAGKIRHEGEVEFDAVVGSDGRLHRPRLKSGLGEAHEKAILRALALWRFEPARQGDKPMAARIASRLVFRIY